MRMRRAPQKKRGPLTLARVYESAKMFDMYPKVEAEHTRKSKSGGAVSVFIAICITALLLSETREFLTPTTTDHVAVDSSLEERLRINLNVTFHALTCKEVELVAMDVAGEHQLHVDHAMHKTRLSRNGVHIGRKILGGISEDTAVKDATHPGYCGSCYGARPVAECCNTCESLREAYAAKRWDVGKIASTAEQCVRAMAEQLRAAKAGEGCELEGHITVNKVAGNFHVALGKSKSVNGRLLHTFDPAKVMFFNTSHEINTLSFGAAFARQSNPLSRRRRIPDPTKCRTAVAQYFIKIVPAMVHSVGRLSGYAVEIASHQYSFTEKWNLIGTGTAGTAEHRKWGRDKPILPGVFWMYDLSPFVVHRTTKPSATLLRYITRLCAVIGGIISLSSMAHGVFEQLQAMMRKRT